MKPNCPHFDCPSTKNPGPISGHVIGFGSFRRSSDSRWIKRYLCKACGRHFSRATLSPNYLQKKRRINSPLHQLISSGVSQRRAALLLKVNRKTIVRRFRFLAEQARIRHREFLNDHSRVPIQEIEFDDLETAEHTKCKPLSVSLAVDPKCRKILDFQVSRMPAKGHLSRIAFKKYGYRKDERKEGWERLFQNLKAHTTEHVILKSDENPHYPKFIKKHFPTATHLSFLGARGSISGGGELKRIGKDPLFALNHTCAMLRANLNRLFRRTWCTTKTIPGLIDHLSIYVDYHNRILTPASSHLPTLKGAS